MAPLTSSFIVRAWASTAVWVGASAVSAQLGAVEPYWAAVGGAEALIRSGEGERFYPVGKLAASTLVRIEAEGNGWAKAAYPPGLTVFVPAEAVQVQPDGKSVTLTRPTQPRAAKLDANRALGSWKPAFERPLPAGTVLTLASPAAVDDAGGKTSYRVVPPAGAMGYVPLASLTRATPEQVAAYLSAHPEATPGAAPLAPAAPTQAGGVTPNEVVQPAATTTVAEKPRESSLPERLEASFEAVRKQPTEDAEIEQLIAQFEKAIAEQPNTPLTERLRARMRQRIDFLKIQQELQAQMRAMNEAQPKMDDGVAAAGERIKELEKVRQYVVIGRLSASTLYDGKRLPLMYRVQSVGASMARTLGYIKPDESLKLEAKLGQVIGVVGDTTVDSTLKLTLIQPRRVDVLMGEPALEPAAPGPAAAAEPPAETPTDGGG